jgi:hypothetical protein
MVTDVSEENIFIFRFEVDIFTAIRNSNLREECYFTSITSYTHEDSHTNAESPDISEETVVKCRLQDGLVCVVLVKRVDSVKRS